MAPYSFKCKDIGMECGFETKAKTKEDLTPKIVEHAKSAHNITESISATTRMVTEGNSALFMYKLSIFQNTLWVTMLRK